MKKEFIRYFNVVFGLLLCSVGVIIILNTNLGLSPWDVLHQGLNLTFGITLGEANIYIGVAILIIDCLLKQPIGSATILNVILIGIFMDLLILFNVIPVANGILSQVLMLILGIIVFAYGCYLYMAMGLGCGPRDGLLTAISKKSSFSPGVIKTFIEVFPIAIGFLLGGTVGVGTIIFSLAVGPLIQFFFTINKKNIKLIEHKSLFSEIKSLKSFLFKRTAKHN